MIFQMFGYTVNIFRSKASHKLSSNDNLFRVVSDGQFLRITDPNGNFIPLEIECTVTSGINELPKATVTMFVNLDHLHLSAQ